MAMAVLNGATVVRNFSGFGDAEIQRDLSVMELNHRDETEEKEKKGKDHRDAVR